MGCAPCSAKIPRVFCWIVDYSPDIFSVPYHDKWKCRSDFINDRCGFSIFSSLFDECARIYFVCEFGSFIVDPGVIVCKRTVLLENRGDFIYCRIGLFCDAPDVVFCRWYIYLDGYIAFNKKTVSQICFYPIRHACYDYDVYIHTTRLCASDCDNWRLKVYFIQLGCCTSILEQFSWRDLPAHSPDNFSFFARCACFYYICFFYFPCDRDLCRFKRKKMGKLTDLADFVPGSRNNTLVQS